MDWRTIGNYALLIGLFVTAVAMFNQINDRMDRLQAEMKAALTACRRKPMPALTPLTPASTPRRWKIVAGTTT